MATSTSRWTKFEAYGQLSGRDRVLTRPARRRPQGAGARQARPARLRPLEERQARRAVLGQPLGRRAAGLAHRVLGDGPRDARRPDRHPRRRARPDLPAPRERAGPERGVHRRPAVRAVLGPRRPGHDRRREDGALAGELPRPSRTCSPSTSRWRCACICCRPTTVRRSPSARTRWPRRGAGWRGCGRPRRRRRPAPSGRRPTLRAAPRLARAMRPARRGSASSR